MRHRLDKLEFYITNTCNLACPECNRFNNHDFRGHQLWQDYEKDYAEWARILEVNSIVLLGGEPLLNPSICDWITGLNKHWDNPVQVLTNGTRINKTPGLYECLASYQQEPGNWLGIHVHNSNDLDRIIHEVQQFLRGKVLEFHAIKGSHSRSIRQTLPTYKTNISGFELVSSKFKADYSWLDENNVGVRLWVSNSFHNASIRVLTSQQVNAQRKISRFALYNNDPADAHKVCGFVQYKNYHMIRGRLNKCGPSVLMAEFDQQHTLDISAEDREILHSYRGLSAWDSQSTIDYFLEHIDDVIPQCKFCPSSQDLYTTTIFAKSKKRGSTGLFG